MSSERSLLTGGTGTRLLAITIATLAIVAIALGGAGAVVADDHDQGQEVTDDVSSPVWIGQEITITDIDDGEYDGPVSIVEGSEGSDWDDPVVTSDADGGEVTLETDALEDDTLYHVHVHNDEDAAIHGTEFLAASEQFGAAFLGESVSDEGETTLEIDSERDEQYVDVAADGLDASELETLFDREDVSDDDTVARFHLAVDDGSTDVTLDFDALEEPPLGDLTLAMDVVDSAAADDATVYVTDEEQYAIVDTTATEQGGVGTVTVDVSHSSTAAVVLRDAGEIHETSVELENVGTEPVQLVYNTDLADDEDGAAWMLASDADASIADRNQTSVLEDDEPFPAYDWEVAVGDRLADDDAFELDEEFQTDTLEVTEREAIGPTTTATAPVDDAVANGGHDATVTEHDVIADQDAMIVTLEEFGAEGYVAGLDADEPTAEGIGLEIGEAAPGPVDPPEVWNASEEGDLEMSVLNTDPAHYDGDLHLLVENGHDVLEPDLYEARVTIDEDNRYVEDADEAYEGAAEFELAERDLEWDFIDSLPAESDATATGWATLAPGTDVAAGVYDGDDLLAFTATTVAADGTVEAEFDLAGQSPGTEVDLRAYDEAETIDDDELAPDAVREDVEIDDSGTVGPVESPLSIDVDYPDEIDEDESGDLAVTLTNDADESLDVDVDVALEGTEWSDSETLTVDADDTESTSWTLEADTLDIGDHDLTVTADADVDGADDDYEGTLAVVEADDGADSDDDDDDTDDGTPGFGLLVAVGALLGAAGYALRRGR